MKKKIDCYLTKWDLHLNEKRHFSLISLVVLLDLSSDFKYHGFSCVCWPIRSLFLNIIQIHRLKLFSNHDFRLSLSQLSIRIFVIKIQWIHKNCFRLKLERNFQQGSSIINEIVHLSGRNRTEFMYRQLEIFEFHLLGILECLVWNCLLKLVRSLFHRCILKRRQKASNWIYTRSARFWTRSLSPVQKFSEKSVRWLSSQRGVTM